MKPFAYIVRQNETKHSIHYSREEAERYKSWSGSNFPITELYERSTQCTKQSFDAGYEKACNDLQIVFDAVDLLYDFSQTVAGGSSFFDEEFNDDFYCAVEDARSKCLRALAGYKENK